MVSNRKLEAVDVCGEASNSWAYPDGISPWKITSGYI